MRSDGNSSARTTLVFASVLLSAAACSRQDTDSGRSGTAVAPDAVEPLPPAATMHPDDIANVTASYDCGGMRVDIIRDQVARVNLAVDNIVKIERIQGSVPATYQDVGLTLTVRDAGADLDDENGRSLSCTPLAKPAGNA